MAPLSSHSSAQGSARIVGRLRSRLTRFGQPTKDAPYRRAWRRRESVTAGKTRVAATALSFALCFAYLVFLPFHAWGLAALIAVGTLVLTSLRQAGDVGVGGITTAAVMVIGALSPHHPWQQPIIGAVDTAVGIAIGLAASWLASGNLVDGLRRQPAARGG